MRSCPASCPCRHPRWLPDGSVSIFSTGATYTLVEVSRGVYVYRYLQEPRA